MSTYSTPSRFVYISLSLYTLSLLKNVSNYFIAWCHPTHFSSDFFVVFTTKSIKLSPPGCSGNFMFIISRAAVNFYYDFKFSCSPVFFHFSNLYLWVVFHTFFLSFLGVMVSDNRYIVGDQYLMAPTTTSTSSWNSF